MKPSNRLEHLILDRVGQLFTQALVASDLRQSGVDAADKTAAAAFLTDERRAHPDVIAATLAASK